MDQPQRQDSLSAERGVKTLSQVTDAKLIEASKTIFNEITSKHKLNERRIRRLIDKNALICQNSFELEKMFKVRLLKRTKVNLKSVLIPCRLTRVPLGHFHLGWADERAGNSPERVQEIGRVSGGLQEAGRWDDRRFQCKLDAGEWSPIAGQRD